MARGRLELKRIENAANRQATFCRRRMQLLKRARELSSVCDAEVALIGFSSSGTLFEYAGPRSMQEIIQAYSDTRAGNRSAYCPLQDDIVRLKAEMQRLEKQERRMEELEFLSVMELEKLESELASDLKSVRRTKDLVIAERRKEFVRKEQELLRENESLRKELNRARSGVEEGAASTACSANDEDAVASVDSQPRGYEL